MLLFSFNFSYCLLSYILFTYSFIFTFFLFSVYINHFTYWFHPFCLYDQCVINLHTNAHTVNWITFQMDNKNLYKFYLKKKTKYALLTNKQKQQSIPFISKKNSLRIAIIHVLLIASEYALNYRCLDRSQFFPPGRSIWCNNSTRKGPTARPTTLIGGHACCRTADLCNLHLKPIILDYRQYPVGEYSKGGDEFVVFGFLFLKFTVFTFYLFFFFINFLFCWLKKDIFPKDNWRVLQSLILTCITKAKKELHSLMSR